MSAEGNFLFQQVYDYIITGIERGEWSVHDKLPSIRQLADKLGVHRLTVFRAYQLLKHNKKAYVKEKSGYYVSPSSDEDSAYNHGAFGPLVTSLEQQNPLSDIQGIHVAYQYSQSLIDPNLLPNLFLSEHVKKVFDMYPKLMATYSSVQGDPELREALCDHFFKRHHIQRKSSDLLITNGAQQAIDLLARVFIRTMDPVMVERPTYSVALDIFRQHGARLIPVDIFSNGYDLEYVENVMKRDKPRFFYINPTFHNPTGYSIPTQVRKRLVELAEKYRCLIIEDDAFHDIYFDAPAPQPLVAYDTDGWVVYIRSFSKYIAPGLRICAVVAGSAVMKTLITAKSLADNGSPLVTQKIFLHYFGTKRMQQHLEKLRTALQIRRDIVERELTSAGWNWVSPKGGLNLWVKLPESMPVESFLNECIQSSISFVPGIYFDPLKQMTSWIRMSYSFVSEGLLYEGVRRMVEIARRFGTD